MKKTVKVQVMLALAKYLVSDKHYNFHSLHYKLKTFFVNLSSKRAKEH